MGTRGPRIASHDHGSPIAVTQMDQFIIVETERKSLPECSLSVTLLVAPVVVHPRQRIRAAFVPCVQEVERVPGVMHPCVQEMSNRPRLILVLRLSRDKIREPSVLSEYCEALPFRRLSGTAELSRGVKHDAANCWVFE